MESVLDSHRTRASHRNDRSCLNRALETYRSSESRTKCYIRRGRPSTTSSADSAPSFSKRPRPRHSALSRDARAQEVPLCVCVCVSLSFSLSLSLSLSLFCERERERRTDTTPLAAPVSRERERVLRPTRRDAWPSDILGREQLEREVMKRG